MSTQIERLRALVRELIKKELEEVSVTGAIDGGEGPPRTPYAFQSKPKKKKDKEKEKKIANAAGYSKVSEARFALDIKDEGGVKLTIIVDAGSAGAAKMKVARKLKGGAKSISNVRRVQPGKAKQVDKKLENVNEGKYHDYRNDESLSPKQKIGYSMREVRDKLNELDRLVKMNVRLKNEVGVDSTSYWKRTHSAMKKISERLVKLANKVGQLY
tara:strand:+ start:614 stop:1255 length:642 start_codon:yes stop_codon:yes gene_type:complete